MKTIWWSIPSIAFTHPLMSCSSVALHLTLRSMVSLRESPSMLNAMHWYRPLCCRRTFCRTSDWFVTIIPDDWDVSRGLLSKSHKTSLIHGLALMWHSRYTSLPSRMLSFWMLAPKLRLTCGATDGKDFKVMSNTVLWQIHAYNER